MTIKEAIEILKDLRIYDDDCETDVEALTIAIDTLEKLEEGKLIELPCKVGDTVYVIPSLTNCRLNVLHGLSENNRVCEQKVHSIQMWKPDEWCLWTCDGVNLLLQKYYKKTWFLTREEAEKALEELKNNG